MTTAARWIAPLATTAVVLAGCGSASQTTAKSASGGASSMANMSSSSMANMNMGSAGTAETKAAGSAVSVGGITAVPTQVLATATWQGMKIQAMAMTAVPFVVDNGTSEHEIKPSKGTSFHLMVMLNDAVTHVPIPYAQVWATIRTQSGKLVSDEETWPMISRYMGPHYGENITVPGAGTYRLSLLVTPPASARHMEYSDVWTKPHRVNVTFHWRPPGT